MRCSKCAITSKKKRQTPMKRLNACAGFATTLLKRRPSTPAIYSRTRAPRYVGVLPASSSAVLPWRDVPVHWAPLSHYPTRPCGAAPNCSSRLVLSGVTEHLRDGAGQRRCLRPSTVRRTCRASWSALTLYLLHICKFLLDPFLNDR